MTDATLLTYEEIKTGEVFAFQRTISQEDVLVFSKLTGDRSPLHINEEFGKNSKFGKNVVHGMLIGALFSTLIGMHCPGKKSLYMSQTLQFKLPLFAGDTLTVKWTVISKHDAIRIVTIKTEVFRGNDMIVTGEAKTQVVEY